MWGRYLNTVQDIFPATVLILPVLLWITKERKFADYPETEAPIASKSMPTRAIRVEATGQHTIRARLYSPPSAASSKPFRAAVLAPPSYDRGGSYNDHVIVSLAALLEDLGYLVLTFNFRRRKLSWNGHVEVEDMRSCIDWLLHAHEGIRELIVGGYAYGALVASACMPHAILDRQVKTSWLFVSLPLNQYKYSYWMFPKPKRVYADRVLGIWGSDDEMSPQSRYKKKQDRPEWTVRTLEGSGQTIEDDDTTKELLRNVQEWIDTE